MATVGAYGVSHVSAPVTSGSGACVVEAQRLVDIVDVFCSALSDKRRTVMEMRIVAAIPATCAHVAGIVGASGEWVRRLHGAVNGDLHTVAGGQATELAALLHVHLGPVVPTATLNAHIADLLPGETLPAVAARHLLRGALPYSDDGTISADEGAASYAEAVRRGAARSADDAGIVAESELFADVGVDDAWGRWRDALLSRCGLHRINDGFVALQDIKKARVKARFGADRASCFEAELAQRSGVPLRAVAAVLSSLRSVVRSDKARWALRDWHTDVYEGLPQQMARRIADAGGQVDLDEMAAHFAAAYGVKEDSVRHYARSPMFSRAGSMISVATRPLVAERPLREVVSGVDGDGVPYWGFTVSRRLLTNLSLSGVPREVAAALGCSLGDAANVALLDPPECRDLYVTSRLASFSGATIGHLAEPLHELGAAEGDRVCLRVEGPNKASLRIETAART